jgi:hypothetical protein
MTSRDPRDDIAHAQQLLRDLALINARTARELGPLPPGGLPPQIKRKPELPPRRPTPATTIAPGDDTEDAMNLKTFATATALGVASTLAACSSDSGTVTQREQTAAASAEAMPAATATEADIAPTAVASPQTSTTTDASAEKKRVISPGPIIPKDELRRRILRLIDSVRTPEGMSRANVESMMLVDLIESSELPGHWTRLGGTDQPWNYVVMVTEKEKKEDGYPRIRVYASGEDVPSPTPLILCSYDIEELATDIVALGYFREPRLKQPRGHVLFKWETPNRDYGVAVKVFRYALNPEAVPFKRRYCFENIMISAGKFNHE